MDHSLNGIRVAILVSDGFEQIEMEVPRQALNSAGAKTFLVSPQKKHVEGWNHHDKGDTFPVDIPLSQARSKNFDALLLPGGVVNPDTLRITPEAVDFVKQMNKEQKPIAAICHGPWLLIEAGVVKGKRITSWASIKTDLINAGAKWQDKPVVCDGQLLTSRKPEDIPQFSTAMIELFQPSRVNS